MIQTETDIQEIYEKEFGKVDSESGFSLTILKSQKGNWVVTLWYERSSWSDVEKQRQVVYDVNGVKIN